MTLRIIKPDGAALAQTGEPDSWATRLAKLIPAEALGFYGAGTAIVPDNRPDGLWFLAGISLVFIVILRYFTTRATPNGPPQWMAIGIASISFFIWLAALQPPAGPFNLGDNAFYAALFALAWGTMIPVIYKG